jgi:hypothetical protein
MTIEIIPVSLDGQRKKAKPASSPEDLARVLPASLKKNAPRIYQEITACLQRADETIVSYHRVTPAQHGNASATRPAPMLPRLIARRAKE